MRLCRPRVSSSSSSPHSALSNRPSSPPLRALSQQLATVHTNRQHGLSSNKSAAGGAVVMATAAGASSSAPSSTAASSAPIHVEFFYDILSPYSYFAFETLVRYRTVWNIELDLKPVFQGALMAQTKNQPPAFIPAKATHLAKDLQRLAKYFDLPFRFPPTRMQEVMFGSLSIQRLLVAVKSSQPPEVLEGVTRAFWNRHWVRDEDILAPESKLAALVEGGLTALQAQQVLVAALEAPAKEQLVAFTAQALKYGAFGVPSMVFPVASSTSSSSGNGNGNGEACDPPGEKALVFGSDRFHIMAQLLNKEYLGPKPVATATGAMPATTATTVPKRKIMSRL